MDRRLVAGVLALWTAQALAQEAPAPQDAPPAPPPAASADTPSAPEATTEQVLLRALESAERRATALEVRVAELTAELAAMREDRPISVDEWKRLDDKLPTHEGDPIPTYYRLERRPQVGLIVAGASMTGAGWLFSTVAAAIDADTNQGTLIPLLVPVFGPWITLGTAPTSFAGAWALVLDGLVQTAGLGMMVGGGVHRKDYLFKLPYGSVSVLGTPTPDGGALAAVGRF